MSSNKGGMSERYNYITYNLTRIKLNKHYFYLESYTYFLYFFILSFISSKQNNSRLNTEAGHVYILSGKRSLQKYMSSKSFKKTFKFSGTGWKALQFDN